MSDDRHRIEAVREKRVTDVQDYTGDRLVDAGESDIIQQTTDYFVCCCDRDTTFDTAEEAMAHLDAVNAQMTGEDVLDVARRMRDDSPIATGVRENGFIVRKGLSDHYFVGFDLSATAEDAEAQAPNEFIVFELTGRTETWGRNDPRLKTQRQYVVEGEAYRVPLAVPPEDSRDFADSLAEIIDADGEQLERGYLPANRTTRLAAAVTETLDWYEGL